MSVEDRLQELLAEQDKSATVSMRELNQKTRAVIDRVVKEGATLTLTDRGKPIAQIRPVRQKSGWDRLEELGLVAQRGGRFEPGWKPATSGIDLEKWLDEERGEDRLERVAEELRALNARSGSGGSHGNS